MSDEKKRIPIQDAFRKLDRYDELVELVRALEMNLAHEHEEAVGEGHYERQAAGEIGCSVCALINKSANFEKEVSHDD